jgi:acetate---CoA ligase (ADP-forming)
VSGRAALAAMLEARSVAVVGASQRPGSFGEQLMLQLVRGGYQGAVYPVNPRYPEVLGRRCLPSLAALPEPVDLAILGVGDALVEAQLEAAAAAGAASAVIFSSCWEAPGRAGPPLAVRLRAIAGRAGMALCGGNGMGFLHLERRLRACGFPEPDGLPPGPVTFLSHSGSAFSALLHNDRGLAFNLVVSSGLELVTTMADYLDYALDLDSTRVVALFVETARDPAALRAALAKAAERDVPVVALKVGRTRRARALVAAHSGALAGEDGAYQALFDAHGVLRVATLDELADTVELLAAGRRAGPGGLATVHDSGGERAHLVDAAADAGVGFARIGAATIGRLAAVLDGGLAPGNPLDAWGTGNDAEAVFLECLRALADDPDTAAVALCVDLTTEPRPGEGYTGVAIRAAAGTAKPVAVLANLAGAVDRRDAALLRAAGVPVLEGTATGLAALGHLLAYRDARARPPLAPPAHPPDGLGDRWRARLRGPGPELGEVEALALLADYGIPAVGCERCASLDEALAAAARVGWPVALKLGGPGVRHKSDVDGVRLGIAGPGELRAAWADLAGRHGPDLLVAAMAAPGVELALGVVSDPQFGPLVMVAAGGVLVELLADRRFALPPIDRGRARALVDRLAVRPLLDGVRGAPPADLDAVADALVRLSVLAADLGPGLDALDVNPLVAGPDGCVAVDALVIRRTAGAASGERAPARAAPATPR